VTSSQAAFHGLPNNFIVGRNAAAHFDNLNTVITRFKCAPSA